MRQEYAFFPGCVTSAREFGCELSTREVFKALDMGLRDVDDFSCCMPAFLVHSFDYVTGLALTSRNLCVADELGLDILTICVSCYGNLMRAKHLLEEDQFLRKKVEELLALTGRKYTGKAKVKHVVTTVYENIGLRNLRKIVIKPLKEIKAAPFYGCHLIRPQTYVKFDDSEFPAKLDQLIAATGATSVYHKERAGCCIGCGAFLGGVSELASFRLATGILDSAKEAGADCIVVTCPYCLLELEMGELKAARETGKTYNLPVLHYMDLLGLSLGLNPKELGLDLHRIKATSLLEKIK
jgi:heterodisulfide reductase subunit B